MVANTTHIIAAPNRRSRWGRRRKILGMATATAAAVLEIIFQTIGIPYLTARLPSLAASTLAFGVPVILQEVGDLAWVFARCDFDTYFHSILFRTGVDPEGRDALRKNSFSTFLNRIILKIPVKFYSFCQVGRIRLKGTTYAILFAALMVSLNIGFRWVSGQTRGVIDNWSDKHDEPDYEQSQEIFNRPSLVRAFTDGARRILWMILFLVIWVVLLTVDGGPEVSDALFTKFLKDAWSLDDHIEKSLKAGVLAVKLLKG